VILSRNRIDGEEAKVGLSIIELPNDSIGQDDFSRANCMSTCSAARNLDRSTSRQEIEQLHQAWP
jgi:hypothetical protein